MLLLGALGGYFRVQGKTLAAGGDWGSANIEVEAYTWTSESLVEADCKGGDCLHYERHFSLNLGESATLKQQQSWPVLLTWKSVKPVTIPALGILEPTVEGKAYFNPWKDMSVAFCQDTDCSTKVGIDVVTFDVRNDCVEQPLEGMYQAQPNWLKSQGEAYGVSNLDGEYCTDWTCTQSAPAPACFGTDRPNTEACGEGGCECNLDPWTHPAPNVLEYKAVISAIRGLQAPWFADRWATGGLYAVNDGNTVFRMSTRVSLSDTRLIFRPVIDMRTNWDGLWTTIPRPDGWEGPPLFRNAVNEFIAPIDGYWPLTWEVTLDSAVQEAWMQPVWNVIVKPGGENGTARLTDLKFEACGSGVEAVVCGYEGCSF